jgi:Ca2+/H+ antiporter, TMEM165/GDT1 family
MTTLSVALPAISAAFLAALVEAVEAATIVLAVGTARGWRSAGAGAVAALVALVLITFTLGPFLERVPLRPLQFVIGVLLLLFGMRWLRKAILRAIGVIPLHDEQLVFEKESALLRYCAQAPARLDWIAAVASFKAVLLEGLEVVFIVLAIGAGHGLVGAASVGAALACCLIIAIGWAVRRPLARLPENTLKFAVGILLSAFGAFWTGEGLGVPWPGGDFAIPGIAILFLLVALAMIEFVRRPGTRAQS